MYKQALAISLASILLFLPANGQVAQNPPEASRIGQPASPAFMQTELTDLQGQKFRLEDLRGKVILVNLWGIWCGPCHHQMPELVELQGKYDRDEFEVVGVSVGDADGEPETVRAIKIFTDRLKVNYYISQSSKAMTKEIFSVVGFDVVPETVIIDRNGLLQGIFIGNSERVNDAIRSAVDSVVNPK